jgi:hypothetical protein
MLGEQLALTILGCGCLLLQSCRFPFAPHYFEFSGLRLHYLDEEPAKSAADRIGEGCYSTDWGQNPTTIDACICVVRVLASTYRYQM